jgi:hypothetical protein
MSTVTYTVYTPNGHILSRNRTVAEAAQDILTYDGQLFEIRNHRSFFALFTKSRNQEKFEETVCYTANCTRAEAIRKIYHDVVDSSCNWSGACYACAYHH